jgi:CheY-like chemotaxis protein
MTRSGGAGGIYAVESLRGRYVLVVDGDREGRLLLQTILRYCGAYVRVVGAAREALALMRQMLPDVLVVDLGCDQDGAFVGTLRALKPESGGMVRVVALGACGEDEAARCRGFDAVLAKPFDPWELCHLVSSLPA